MNKKKAESLRIQAIEASSRGEFEPARKLLNEALELLPAFAAGYAARAGTHLDLHDFKAALNDVNQAIALDGNQGVYFQKHSRRLGGK